MEALDLSYPLTQSTSVIDAFANYAVDQPGDALPFYEPEGRLLALWDQLNDLKLEVAMMEAQANPPSDVQEAPGVNGEKEAVNEQVSEATLKEAEKECLEARATYTLRQSVVEDVLMADPILKAVHSGPNATPTQRCVFLIPGTSMD